MEILLFLLTTRL